MLHWIVLSNEVGEILAVYGSALEEVARNKGFEIQEQTGCRVAMHFTVGDRPRVHSSISMSGAHVWLVRSPVA